MVDKHPPPNFFAPYPAINVLKNPFMSFSFLGKHEITLKVCLVGQRKLNSSENPH